MKERDMQIDKCPLCDRSNIGLNPIFEKRIYKIFCPNCLKYDISEEAIEMIASDRSISAKRHIISGMTRLSNIVESDALLLLTSNIEDIFSSTLIPRKITDKIKRILEYFNEQNDGSLSLFEIDKTLFPTAFAKDTEELKNLLDVMEEGQLISYSNGTLTSYPKLG